MFAVVCIPNFALQSLLRHEPELRERPVALVEAADAKFSKALILECTGAAEAASVFPGLTAPQAQARCRELVLKSRSLAAEQRATEILLQTAYAFSPNIENTAPGVCTIDLRGLNFGGSRSDEAQKPQLGNSKSETNRVLFTPAAAHDNTTQQSFDFFSNAAVHSPSLLNGERAGVRCGYAGMPDDDRSNRSDHPSLSMPLLVEGGRKPDINRLQLWGTAIVGALRECSLDAQLGIATSPNLALLAARAAKPILVIDQVHEFFESLPFAALDPTPQVFDIVRRWGIHTAGAFLVLGQEAIAERLGAEALEIFHRASAQIIRPLNIVVPPDTFEERIDFEAHIETIEPLLFVLRRFVEQLATRIMMTYRVVGELALTLGLESGLPYQRAFKVPAPTANAGTLFRMLHTHLENLHTDAPIQSLRLSATPCRSENQQFSLFESALRDPNHFHETFARLTALLGTERVGTPVAEATHRPDAFQIKTPVFGNDESRMADGQTQSLKPPARNTSGLCLRRFRTPIHADVELRDGRPQFINTLLVSARIKRVRGPWCRSGTWWDERRWARQEWDVETEKGELYRLRNANGNWVLEGIYD